VVTTVVVLSAGLVTVGVAVLEILYSEASGVLDDATGTGEDSE
jgi:hypothetical protein